jgi:hypothetical protein
MSITEACLIVATATAVVGQLAQVWLSFGTRRHIAEVKDATNHMMHEALEAKGITSFAEGRASRDAC